MTGEAVRRRIALIVLAAGSSRRFEPANKLMAEFRGEPLIRQTVAELCKLQGYPVYVVTGGQGAQIAGALEGLPVVLVANPDHASGMMSSIKAGLKALPPRIDAAMICLGDMPLITADLVARLIAAYDPAERRLIVVPVGQGVRGNPVLWDQRFFAEMEALSGDRGARSLMALHEDVIAEVDVGSDAIFCDIDVPGDLERLAKRPIPQA